MGASISPRDGGGGKRRRGHAKNRPMDEINVTPFVDVMLVLLIIFMVAAPMLTVGVPIELPKSAAQPLATEQEEPLTIALSSEGKIVLQNIEIKNENLIEKLMNFILIFKVKLIVWKTVSKTSSFSNWC